MSLNKILISEGVYSNETLPSFILQKNKKYYEFKGENLK
nr:MAG TPA: hypothetical protein [Bacteriophage sp.]